MLPLARAPGRSQVRTHSLPPISRDSSRYVFKPLSHIPGASFTVPSPRAPRLLPTAGHSQIRWGETPSGCPPAARGPQPAGAVGPALPAAPPRRCVTVTRVPRRRSPAPPPLPAADRPLGIMISAGCGDSAAGRESSAPRPLRTDACLPAEVGASAERGWA